jgi:hypothetical protein
LTRILRLFGWLAAGALWMAAAACLSPPVSSPKTTVTQSTPVRVPQNSRNAVDVLFMIDNSSSMDSMQAQLKARFGDFFQVFNQLAADGTYADLHIGVVTSDFGAGDKGSGACDAYGGGDQGLLQARGVAAAADCLPPTGGTPYIEFAFDPNGGAATSNLPGGQDLVKTFTCMASVGATGCGFEHQLESVWAALKDMQHRNGGFLRSDALLTVVFVTNEDDGSAPPTAKFYEADADKGVYGAYDTYRQSRFALTCGGAPMPYASGVNGVAQALNGCQAASNPMGADVNLAFDLTKYETLFLEPSGRGGIKPSADDVILVGIDGPELPTETVVVDNTTGLGAAGKERYASCGPMLASNCVVRLQHSCQNNAAPVFFADPAVRINALINKAKFHKITSICGDNLNQTPDYSGALRELAQLISSKISPGCIPAKLTDAAHPDCSVKDVTTDAAGNQTPHVLPQCDATASVVPCWKAEVKTGCASFSPDSIGITIERGGLPAPAMTTASVECATDASVSM